MKKHRFLITGYGRSGTRFLAQLMDSSEQWTVIHEPFSAEEVRLKQHEVVRSVIARARFWQTDYYGEVSSYSCAYVEHLLSSQRREEVGKIGFIVRNPYEIIRSMLQRRKPEQWTPLLENLASRLQTLSWCKAQGLRCINFHRMVSDPCYTKEQLEFFGVIDVPVTEETLARKVNASAELPYDIEDMSIAQRALARKFCNPFIKEFKL